MCTVVQVTKQRRSVKTDNCCGGLAALLSPRVFKALSDPKRLSLFTRLVEQRRPCTIGELAEGSEVDLSVVSRHLGLLRDAGIIRCVKRGKEVWCTVDKGAVIDMLRNLATTLETCCPDETIHGEMISKAQHTRP